jgi:hypothetical protein
MLLVEEPGIAFGVFTIDSFLDPYSEIGAVLVTIQPAVYISRLDSFVCILQ